MRASEDNATNAEPAVAAGSHSSPVTCYPSGLRAKAAFKSAHVEWGTPPDLLTALEKEFHFTLDPCAPGQLWDGRSISWAGQRVFCNPPYGKGIDKWLAKGPEAELAVYLLPARTDTRWFHDHALLADEIRFFRGRIKFVENHIVPDTGWSNNAAPFPSMLVIYRVAKKDNAEVSDGVCEKQQDHD